LRFISCAARASTSTTFVSASSSTWILRDRDVAQIVERGAHQRRHRVALVTPAATVTASAPLVIVFGSIEMLADACRFLADGGEALEHRIDEVAVLFEMRAARVGDGAELFCTLGLRRDVARLFQIGECRIDDARARRIPARGALFEQLDDLVAVAWLLGDQRERDQAEVALRQHAPGTHHVAAAMSPAEPATEVTAPAPSSGCPVALAAMSRFKHEVSPSFDISLDTTEPKSYQ